MKRAVQAGLAAACLVLAGLALFTGRAGRGGAAAVDLRARPSAAAPFRAEATLRNVTGGPIAYAVKPGPGRPAPPPRTLAVGAVDRFLADAAFAISYDNGRRTAEYTVHPGQPYSFRYDEEGVVRVYPGSHGRTDAADLAPFVPTPPEVVERMLELAEVGEDDVVYDIGCGDGRMVIAAAKTYRARGVGIDIDAALIENCRLRAREEGVESLVRFVRMDGTRARVGEATVVALYLLPESLETLKPLFERELRPGVRIVSHDYRVPGWDDRLVRSESLAAGGGRDHKIHLYRMPGRT